MTREKKRWMRRQAQRTENAAPEGQSSRGREPEETGHGTGRPGIYSAPQGKKEIPKGSGGKENEESWEPEELCRRIVERLDMSREIQDEELLEIIDEEILSAGRDMAVSVAQKARLRKKLYDSLRRLDLLQELLDDDTITEIMVNGYKHIFIERGGRIQRCNGSFSSREKLEDVIQQIVGKCNRVVNEQSPIVDARLEDGSRVNVVLDPVAVNGPILTIRKFPERAITMEELIRYGSITREAAGFLERLVKAGYSIMVGGGTSSGKTTFLNALSGYIPRDERIITIEDNAELQIQGVDNLVRLESRTANMEGSREVTMDDLIKAALRMRPTRILVGEIRGAEARSYITSLNLGHGGSMATAHANSAQEMVMRLEMMVLMGMELPLPAIRRQIAAGVEILVHLGRDSDGKRKVEEIAEILGMEGEEVKVHALYQRAGAELVKGEELFRREKLERSREE